MKNNGLTNPKPTTKQRLLDAVRKAFIVAAFVGFIWMVGSYYQELQTASGLLDFSMVVTAVVFGMAGLWFSVFVWTPFISTSDNRLHYRQSHALFFIAQMGKYIPGSVWAVVAQIRLARAYNVSLQQAAKAQFLFLWVLVITGLILGTPVAILYFNLPQIVMVVALLLAVTLTPPFLTLVYKIGLPLLPSSIRTNMSSSHITVTSWQAMLRSSLAAVAMWVAYGLHWFFLSAQFSESLLATSFRPSPWNLTQQVSWLYNIAADNLVNVGLSIAVYAIAWTLGFLFVIAPAGLGIREAVLVGGFLLMPLALSDTSFALLAVLVSRFILTIADGVMALLGMVFAGGIPKTTTT